MVIFLCSLTLMQGTHLSLRRPATNDEDDDDAKGCQDIRKFLVPRKAEDLLQETKSLKKKEKEPPFAYILVARIDGTTVWKKSYASIYQ